MFLLQPLWNIIVSTGLVTNPMLEAYVAAFSFLAWVGFFKLLSRTPLRKYRFKASNTSTSNKTFAISKPTDAIAWSSLPVYLIAIQVMHTMNKGKKRPEQEELAPTLPRLLGELSLGIVAYDFIFWFIHLGLHRIPYLYELIHKRHHTHDFIGAGTTVAHSLLDGSLQVFTNILVQHLSFAGYGNKHMLSKLLHNMTVTYMLVEIHAEYDAPFSLHNMFPKWYGGALKHRYHHAYTQPGFKGKGGVHYHEFFRYLDWMFGYEVSVEECRAVTFG